MTIPLGLAGTAARSVIMKENPRQSVLCVHDHDHEHGSGGERRRVERVTGNRALDRVLLLDFDGTICRGDEPVRHYAQLLADELDEARGKRLVNDVDVYLESGASGGVAPGARDGYDAVKLLATAEGLSRAMVRQAFLNARAKLAAGELVFEVPEGLVTFLNALPERVRVAVVTNAPTHGLRTILDHMGILSSVDDAMGDAGKPSGMAGVVGQLLDDAKATEEPWRLLSVGDIWENDLRVPRERGCVTAYIDRFGIDAGPAHARAETLEGLYCPIQRWARDMSDYDLTKVVYPPYHPL